MSLGDLARRFSKVQMTVDRVKNDAARRVEEERNRLVLELRDEVFKIYSALTDIFSFWKSRLEHSLAALCREAEPLGIQLLTSPSCYE